MGPGEHFSNRVPIPWENESPRFYHLFTGSIYVSLGAALQEILIYFSQWSSDGERALVGKRKFVLSLVKVPSPVRYSWINFDGATGSEHTTLSCCRTCTFNEMKI